MDNQECKGPFRASTPIVLASGSPRRKELLERLGLEFAVEVSSVMELEQDSRLSPEELVLYNARLKARQVARGQPGAVVIGADTCVALAGRIFGKPADIEDAASMLDLLSGKWHHVFTGFCVIWEEMEKEVLRAVESRVFLSAFEQEVIHAYCVTGEPLDKAGGYAVQVIGGFMVKAIEGSYMWVSPRCSDD